jgi:hypothetical protein
LGAAPSKRSAEAVRLVSGSSHEVSPPLQRQHSTRRRIIRFHPDANPSSVDLRPMRVSNLVELRGFVSHRSRSWGFRSSGLFPAAELYRLRQAAIPSRRFLRLSRDDRVLRAFCPAAIRAPEVEYCIHTGPMPSRAFIHLRGSLAPRFGLVISKQQRCCLTPHIRS